MTYQEQRTVVHRHHDELRGASPAEAADAEVIDSREVVTTRRTWAGVARRLVVFVFGLVQLVILLRIALLLIDARQGAPIVSAVIDASRPFVGPFAGILRRDVLTSSGSVLDLAAVAAFIGWTVAEAVALGLIGLFGDGS